ncbi:MAG: hypothetical protein CMP07_12730 [Xanthomonadales bacterium]|nr:hypothetical protein [Xanthomonadales bacterium]
MLFVQRAVLLLTPDMQRTRSVSPCIEIIAAQKIGARFQFRFQVCIIDFPDFAADFNDMFSAYLADSVNTQQSGVIKDTPYLAGEYKNQIPSSL